MKSSFACQVKDRKTILISKNNYIVIFNTGLSLILKSPVALFSTPVCSKLVTLCTYVHSAMWHNIHMYPYFLFAAIHHLNCP